MKSDRIFLCSLVAAFAITATAAPVRDKRVIAELVSEVTSIRPGEPFTVGLRVIHDPKWHTYWKNPGIAGVPTTIDWKLPEGFSAGPIQWPQPDRVKMAIYNVYGYEGETILLTEITPPENLKPETEVTLTARPTWMMCADICLPPTEPPTIQLTLPVAKPNDEDRPLDKSWHAAFEKIRSSFPVASKAWKLSALKTGNGHLVLLTAKPTNPRQLEGDYSDAYFFSSDRLIDSHKEQKFKAKDDGRFHLTLPISEFGPKRPTRLKGILYSKSSTWETGKRIHALKVDIPLPPGK